MAVRRQKNWLGQQRVDTTHLREIESAVASDFDDLAGQVLASRRPIVVSGMTIAMNAAVGGFAQQLVLKTASSILLHATASEPGALFVVPSTQGDETLNSQNTKVIGSFTPNSVNYIGIDLVRLADQATADIVKFRSATTKKEFSQSVPLARTLQYRIVISTSDFSVITNVAPVAKVTLDANGIVLDVTDCRQMMFRLGSGGSSPNPLAVFSWPGGRVENPVTSSTTTSPFEGADKSIGSFADFFQALESRLWEVGGGEHWYSATTDRDVLFIRDITNALPNGDNFFWTGTNLHWQAISFSFGNSTAATNLITDQTVDSPGLTDLGVGQALYVDVDRANDGATLTMHKAALINLGTPTIPGSRQLIAWRTAVGVFARGSPYPVGFANPHATSATYGVVKLFADSTTDAIVPATDGNGFVVARGLTRDAAGTIQIGNGVLDTAVQIGHTGVLTDIQGTFQVEQLATFVAGLSAGSQRIQAVANPVAGTDAVNLNTLNASTNWLKYSKYVFITVNSDGTIATSFGGLGFSMVKPATNGLYHVTCTGIQIGIALATPIRSAETFPGNGDSTFDVVYTGTNTLSVQMWDADGGGRDSAFNLLLVIP